jgi:flagellar motor protein MotB
MAAKHSRAREEESYFVSMTDMMVGLLFVFIIMLMYFALQYKDSTQELLTADATRASILEELKESLTRDGVEVTVDTETGVLRLPGDVLFDQGKVTPRQEGVDNLKKLAHALERIIPCYAVNPDANGGRPPSCPPPTHTIELLYVEGHTDRTPIDRGPIRDNWDLSTERAKVTRWILTGEAPVLERLRNAPAGDPTSAPILLHVGMADSRPIPGATSPDQNRRIELRIIMAKPKPVVIEKIESGLGDSQ